MASNSAFLSAIKIQVSDFHREKLRQIDEFDYSKVLKKVGSDSKGLTNRYLEEGCFALKQYYAVALLDPLNEHAVSKFVDPFWHSHVLFTKDYMGFCNEIYGGYIHHSPLDTDDTTEVKRVAGLYEYTLETYATIFNEVDDAWWPSISAGVAGLANRVVCLHMLVNDAEIMARAMFKKRPPR